MHIAFAEEEDYSDLFFTITFHFDVIFYSHRHKYKKKIDRKCHTYCIDSSELISL